MHQYSWSPVSIREYDMNEKKSNQKLLNSQKGREEISQHADSNNTEGGSSWFGSFLSSDPKKDRLNLDKRVAKLMADMWTTFSKYGRLLLIK